MARVRQRSPVIPRASIRVLAAAAAWFTFVVAGAVAWTSAPSALMSAAADSIPQANAARKILVLTLADAIGPASAKFLIRGIERAEHESAACIVIQIDTPGGLDTSMRDIVKRILASEVPVVVYVAPSGSRAASAGLFVLLSAHVAAMAPGTNTGAAHPVQMGGGAMDSLMSTKVENDAASFIRSLAQKHKRNADWAERAVRASVSASDDEALTLGIVDVVEPSLLALLERLEGREVELLAGPRILQLREAELVIVTMGWRDRLLSAVANPNIAYLLLMLGSAGLMMELWNPGTILPGVVGAISILLAFFALQVLPVNSVGLLLLLLGIVLLLLEVKVTSYGALTIGGIVALTFGSIFLFESRESFYRVSWSVLVPTVIAATCFFVFVVGKGLRAQRRQPTTGTQGMIGKIGTAATPLDPEGRVHIRGEIWTAHAVTPIAAGTKVEIVAVNGLRLEVRPHDSDGDAAAIPS